MMDPRNAVLELSAVMPAGGRLARANAVAGPMASGVGQGNGHRGHPAVVERQRDDVRQDNDQDRQEGQIHHQG